MQKAGAFDNPGILASLVMRGGNLLISRNGVSAWLEVWGRNLLLPASGRVRERVQRQVLLSLRESGFLWKER
jgi:hypothetical protein